MSVSEIDVLEAAARMLRDPDRVVKDPLHSMYETADGAQGAWTGTAERGCFVGCIRMAAHDLGEHGYGVIPVVPSLFDDSPLADRAQLAVMPFIPEEADSGTTFFESDMRADPFTDYMVRNGAEACAEVIDRAVEDLRGRELVAA
jgi:hypothetical protein